MKVLCFLLIAAGGVLMLITNIRYVRILKSSRELLLNRPVFTKIISITTRIMMSFFLVGFFIGCVDVLIRDVEPIYYFVGVVFFVGAIFIFAMVNSIGEMLKSLLISNSKLQSALNIVSVQNDELQLTVEEKVHEVVYQDRLLRSVNDAASTLLSSETDDFEKKLCMSIGALAAVTDVNKIIICKNIVENDEKKYTNVYEWSEGNLCRRNNESSAVFFNDIKDDETRSALDIPIYLKDQSWGFIRFEDNVRKKNFSKGEEAILKSASLLIALCFQRNEMTVSLIEAKEAADCSAKAKSAFLSNMSHEIRTPINAITGMVSIAQRSDDKKKISDCLTKIETASRQLLGLINDILDMSKIEARKMELVEEPFDFYASMCNIKSIVDISAIGKNQTLTMLISSDIPKILIGDEMRLTQILLNLLSNAIKFSPTGGKIELEVKKKSIGKDSCALEISVTDNGIGITKEQQTRLFQSFEQAERNTTRKYGGSGLGLAISQRLAQMMNGEISIYSKPGEGSCFSVSLIMKYDSELQSNYTINKNKGDICFSGVEQLEGKRILVVEDVEINREIITVLLEEVGIDVDIVENGKLAVDAFNCNPGLYDVILMDISMPVMDGLTATKLIRKSTTKRALTIPILAMTANAFDDDINRCMEAGMDSHIAKPIDVDILMNTLLKYIAPECTSA